MLSQSDSVTFLAPQPPTGDKSVAHAAKSGLPCAACLPLTVGEGDCVDRDVLLASSQNGGCSICSFFVTATTTALGSSALWKHASTWVDRGILGLTITKTKPDESSCVAFLAINGGKTKPKIAASAKRAQSDRLTKWHPLSRTRPVPIRLASNASQVALLSDARKGSLDDRRVDPGVPAEPSPVPATHHPGAADESD